MPAALPLVHAPIRPVQPRAGPGTLPPLRSGSTKRIAPLASEQTAAAAPHVPPHVEAEDEASPAAPEPPSSQPTEAAPPVSSPRFPDEMPTSSPPQPVSPPLAPAPADGSPQDRDDTAPAPQTPSPSSPNPQALSLHSAPMSILTPNSRAVAGGISPRKARRSSFCSCGRRARSNVHPLDSAVIRKYEQMSPAERAAMSEAAARVQGFWRRLKHDILMKEDMRAMYSQPDLEKAKRHAENFLPKDRHGNLYPLTTPLKTFHPLGCGVALYMYLVHWWSAFFFAATLITFSSLVLNLEGNGMDWTFLNASDIPPSLSIYTVHSLANTANLPTTYGMTEVVITALFTWFMFWQGTKLKNLTRRITHLETTVANYTVMISRMAADTTRPTAAEFFSRWGEVVHVTVTYNNRKLIFASRALASARAALQSAHVQWYTAKAGSYPERKKRHASEAVARAMHKLYRADKALKAEAAAFSTQASCTGVVFVTFNTVDAAQSCISDLNDKPRYFRGSGPLKCQMAPEPEDIIWENLQSSNTEQIVRLMVSTLIIVIQIVISTVLVTAGMVLLTQTTVDMYNEGPTPLTATVVISVFGVCIAFLIFGYLGIMAMVPVLAYKVERHQTFAARETYIVLKLIFFQVVNVVVPSTTFIVRHGWHIKDEWYPTGGQIIVNSLLADFIFVGFLVDRMRPDVLFFRRFLARRAHTQRQMNALYKRPADIYLALRLQLVVKCIVCAVIYSSTFPILYPIAFIFCVVAEFVDRRNLLRVWAPPPPTDNRLIAAVVRLVIPVAVIGHLITAYFSFEAKSADAPATYITLISACVFGPVIGYFIYREHAASEGRRVWILPGKYLKTSREWFLDLKEETLVGDGKGKHWQPTETFRETNNLSFYVPPLPRHMLQAMGADEEMSYAPIPKHKSSSQLTLRTSHSNPEALQSALRTDTADEEPSCSGSDSPMGARAKKKSYPRSRASGRASGPQQKLTVTRANRSASDSMKSSPLRSGGRDTGAGVQPPAAASRVLCDSDTAETSESQSPGKRVSFLGRNRSATLGATPKDVQRSP
ncbi:hypothetical protein AB1Y20_021761 [Prymnesium parvum]|uniref:CSC1/OSCA1-like cytosolic domain-containing protein n=1 Tax=Prymnesium parvum TaxID=97485 RepID=A0AB34JJP2_PRYPA